MKSGGNWITAQIGLPLEEVSLVVEDSIKLNVNGKVIYAQADQGGGKNRLKVKFDRQEVIDALAGFNGDIELQIIGHLQAGHTFIGKDTITVIH